MEGLTVKVGAESIDMSRILLNRMLGGESSVTTKMALVLERLGWGKAEFWLNSQMRHDLAQARRGAVARGMPRTGRSVAAEGVRGGGRLGGGLGRLCA